MKLSPAASCLSHDALRTNRLLRRKDEDGVSSFLVRVAEDGRTDGRTDGRCDLAGYVFLHSAFPLYGYATGCRTLDGSHRIIISRCNHLDIPWSISNSCAFASLGSRFGALNRKHLFFAGNTETFLLFFAVTLKITAISGGNAGKYCYF